MLKEAIASYPEATIVAISILVTLAMTLVTKYFTDQNRMAELKKIQEACRIKLKEKNLKPEDMSKINHEMLECSLQLTKHSMKPLLFTIIPLILLIGWLRGIYIETAIAKTWLWWYIGSGVASSLVFRKILKVV